MAKKMWAIFTDEAYSDLVNGRAVDNNGFRSPKGSFRPDQPSFYPVNERAERIKDAGVGLGILAGTYVTKEIILPGIKQFCTDKVYPLLCEKWDAWRAYRNAKKTASNTVHASPHMEAAQEVESHSETTDNVINLEDFRKASNE